MFIVTYQMERVTGTSILVCVVQDESLATSAMAELMEKEYRLTPHQISRALDRIRIRPMRAHSILKNRAMMVTVPVLGAQ